MGFRLPSVISTTKRALKTWVPKGHVAVYVGDEEDKQRYVVPLAYLNHPLFQDLLSRAEEEYGFNHPKGGLTIPCDEHMFAHLIAQLSTSTL